MKYFRYLFLFFLVSALYTGCKEDKKPERPSADRMEEVMAIHDEVMPKMGTIGKLVAELKPRVDSTATGQQFGRAMKNLQEAHESMMQWMQGFGNRFDSKEIMEGKELSEEKLQWLDEEEEKVREVQEKINASIEEAEALLEKHPAP